VIVDECGGIYDDLIPSEPPMLNNLSQAPHSACRPTPWKCATQVIRAMRQIFSTWHVH